MSIINESLLTLQDAAQLLPSNRAGKRVNFATVWRWILKGIRATDGRLVRLEAARVGGRWLTSKEALERFAEALTPTMSGTDNSIRTRAARKREIQVAKGNLKKYGI